MKNGESAIICFLNCKKEMSLLAAGLFRLLEVEEVRHPI